MPNTNLDRLPAELTEKILLLCNPFALLRLRLVSKDLSLHIDHVIQARDSEWLRSSDRRPWPALLKDLFEDDPIKFIACLLNTYGHCLNIYESCELRLLEDLMKRSLQGRIRTLKERMQESKEECRAITHFPGLLRYVLGILSTEVVRGWRYMNARDFAWIDVIYRCPALRSHQLLHRMVGELIPSLLNEVRQLARKPDTYDFPEGYKLRDLAPNLTDVHSVARIVSKFARMPGLMSSFSQKCEAIARDLVIQPWKGIALDGQLLLGRTVVFLHSTKNEVAPIRDVQVRSCYRERAQNLLHHAKSTWREGDYDAMECLEVAIGLDRHSSESDTYERYDIFFQELLHESLRVEHRQAKRYLEFAAQINQSLNGFTVEMRNNAFGFRLYREPEATARIPLACTWSAHLFERLQSDIRWICLSSCFDTLAELREFHGTVGDSGRYKMIYRKAGASRAFRSCARLALKRAKDLFRDCRDEEGLFMVKLAEDIAEICNRALSGECFTQSLAIIESRTSKQSAEDMQATATVITYLRKHLGRQ